MSTDDTMHAPGETLPVNPFTALRATHGMLLGQDDFDVLAGNPRGKQMLHTAWLHGSGVVWGYRVSVRGTSTLRVERGLAVDGQGRELRTETAWCEDLDARALSQQEPDEHGRVHGCVVVEFRGCPTSPVPTLADPCDVTRKHDEFSRVHETARIRLLPGRCPGPDPAPCPRVRALLGLHHLEGSTGPGAEVEDAAAAVSTARPYERAAELWRQFRILAAADVTDRGPIPDTGPTCPDPFPVTEAHSPVLLAAVAITIARPGGCPEVGGIEEPDLTVRRALLPTATITELLCGWAPGLVGRLTSTDAGGPRVRPGSLAWSPDLRTLRFGLTHPVQPRSLRNAVTVSSLGDRGWVRQDLAGVPWTEDGDLTVVVELAEPRDNDRYRLVVRGTGETPAYGRDPAVPLAGVEGGAAGTADDGHDAVLSRPHPQEQGRAGS